MSQTPRRKLLEDAEEQPWAVDDQRQRDEAVSDRCGAAYLIMMLLGVGSLLAWNALITPIEYLKLRIAGSDFDSSFESMFSTTFTSISLLSLLAMQRIQHYVSLRHRIVGSLLLLLAVFVLLTGLAVAPLTLADDRLLGGLRDGATAQFTVLIVCGALCGIGQAFLSGSAMAYASIFDEPRYLQAVSGGQGVAGLALTLSNMLVSLPGIARVCASDSTTLHSLAAPASSVSASHARDVITAAAVYFGAACAILVLCLVSFFVVEHLPFTRARLRLLSLP